MQKSASWSLTLRNKGLQQWKFLASRIFSEALKPISTQCLCCPAINDTTASIATKYCNESGR